VTLSGIEVGLRDQRGVDAGEPLISEPDLAEVHLVAEDLPDGRVIDPETGLDGGMAVALA